MIRARGGRITSRRRVLLKTLFRAKAPMSASELTVAVRARSNPLYRSTVHRRVEDLLALGVIVPNTPTR